MPDDERSYFDADNPNHQELVNLVETITGNNDGELSTKELAEKVSSETNTFTSRTARRLLYYAREYIVEEKQVETRREKRDRESAGSPTWMWKHE